jgi:hypothetical protein
VIAPASVVLLVILLPERRRLNRIIAIAFLMMLFATPASEEPNHSGLALLAIT